MLEQPREEWKEWMRLIGEYIYRGICDGVSFSPFDRDLIRFYQSSDAMNALMTMEKPLGYDFAASLMPRDAHCLLDQNRDLYLSSYHWWATLQHGLVPRLPLD